MTPVQNRALLRRPVGIATVVAVVALVSVVTPTFTLGWAPVLHWKCVSIREVSTQTIWAPLSLANSPYGGSVFVNATTPSGPFGSATPGLHVGGGELNGSVWGGLWQVIANVTELENRLVWGPGSNARCTAPFGVTLLTAGPPQVYTGEIFNWIGGPLFGPNSTTDYSEPTSYNLSASINDSSLYFSNGFHTPNAPTVSTCGQPARQVTVQSLQFTVWIPYSLDGRNYTAPFTMPSDQTFDYLFPGNFGTWQVDNLSAAGGPGGGWAFSFSPCPP